MHGVLLQQLSEVEDTLAISAGQDLGYPFAMPPRRFPRPWTVEPMPSGHRIIDANAIALAHVYGQPR